MMDPSYTSDIGVQDKRLHRQSDRNTSSWVKLRMADRIAFLCIALTMACVIAVSFWLTPDTSGSGTHRQLGFPPCSAQTLLGIPCPFCGMTTSWALISHGQWLQAFQTQPAGFVFYFGTIALCMGALLIASIGYWHDTLNKDKIVLNIMWTLFVITLAGWVYRLVAQLALDI